MTEQKVYRAIGLMSGTSLDGVDAALIETDGHGFVRPLGFYTRAYEEETRGLIRACFGLRDRGDARVQKAGEALTLAHIEAIRELGEKADIIGFHGQTVTHDPENRFTLQIGDAALLGRETGTDVVHDFRSADVRAGGQGAPFLPLYHRARAATLAKPLAVLNIGGVANVTWIGEDNILAFDTGPGNALIDDWMRKHAGQIYDAGGRAASSGAANEAALQEFLAHPYFTRKPPKSIDRNDFDPGRENVTTLSMFTVKSIEQALRWMPEKPKEWLVAGGGRRNLFIMEKLREALKVRVRPVEDLGWNGDALEAEGFAYLAVRSLLGEALSLPSTTGVPEPMPGGVLQRGRV